MSRLWQSIVSLWAWLVLVVCVLLWFPILLVLAIITVPFDPGRYLVGLLFRKIGPVMATLNPLWHFRYIGQVPGNPRRPYVVVSNHESFTDILLISHLPWEMKWLSKAELFRIPIMGWMMWLVGDIPVKRGFGPSAIEAMARCRKALANRVSVMIFPEGTRSRTAELLPFKDGAFRLAIEAGVPILASRRVRHQNRASQARLAVRTLSRRGSDSRSGRDVRHDGRRCPRSETTSAADDRHRSRCVGERSNLGTGYLARSPGALTRPARPANASKVSRYGSMRKS